MDQERADTLALVLGQHCYRAQAKPVLGAIRDGYRGNRDLANQGAFPVGDQRQAELASLAQGANNQVLAAVGRGRMGKCGQGERLDGGVVAGLFWPDLDQGTRRASRPSCTKRRKRSG